MCPATGPSNLCWGDNQGMIPRGDSNPQTYHDLCTSTPLRTAPPLAFTTHEDPHPPPGPNYTSFVQYCEEDLVHVDRQTPPTGPTSSLRSVHSTLACCPHRLICLHTSHTMLCGQGKALASRLVLRSSDEGKARQGKARQGKARQGKAWNGCHVAVR